VTIFTPVKKVYRRNGPLHFSYIVFISWLKMPPTSRKYYIKLNRVHLHTEVNRMHKFTGQLPVCISRDESPESRSKECVHDPCM